MIRLIGCGAITCCLLVRGASGQLELDREPIRYSESRPEDPVTSLQTSLKLGDVSFQYHGRHGYLPDVLEQLKVPISSQILVFSKTSFQLTRISPRRPRALYFNDQVAIGWVQGSDVIEVMATDPKLGQVFYTLEQDDLRRPRFQRDGGQCLACHATHRTQGVPGGLVRSVFPLPSGQPAYQAGTFTIDQRSPFEQRWGGYYVTGSHGTMRHMGNVVCQAEADSARIDREAGANVTDLSGRVDTAPYLTSHSDIVALMVLEHQTQMQNFLTLAQYQTRSALHSDAIMNEALDRPDDYRSESTGRRIKTAGDKLLRYLLFADEFRLTSRVTGTSSFSKEFQMLGPRDKQGRSLRTFDLQTRLFKYPCSYLIYSPAFDQLPPPMREYVSTRLREILTGEETSDEFAHLTPADRTAIFEILTDTKPGLWP